MAVTPFKSSDNFNMAGFNEKITEADNTYVAKTGGSMSGSLSMGNNKITDVANPVNDGDVVNKGYVDGKIKTISYTGDGNTERTFDIGADFIFLNIYGNFNNNAGDGLFLNKNANRCFVPEGGASFIISTYDGNKITLTASSDVIARSFNTANRSYYMTIFLK